ncbi:hypothetical protein BN13_250010 [Nostocoides jenkinsii Ben 74]|uniref:Uncharacterized protein n=1 Tax=Nostocoides jenkinsii Ben 74 TaxID=1193518 RepID=A0A077MDH8_9MICO|nr:hypothetical protein BN13_250010 [Tetrasphaera jenkinsii Ben 74]
MRPHPHPARPQHHWGRADLSVRGHIPMRANRFD